MSQSVRRAMVTGGSAGIGLAIVRALRAQGIETVAAARDPEALERTGAPFVRIDVCDPASIASAIAQAGPVDVFVANAGGAATAPALSMEMDEWRRMLDLNLTSVFLCAKAAVPPMKSKGWGRFIAIGSTASVKGYKYAGAYAAAKHGVLGYMRSLALELAGSGVTANAVCPGYTDTPMIARALDTIESKTGRPRSAAMDAFAKTNPMNRLVRPDEVAAAVSWLAGEPAAAVNGQAIMIDGGETA